LSDRAQGLRRVELTEQWLREAGFEVVGSETEKLGLFAVTLARKPAYLSFPKR